LTALLLLPALLSAQRVLTASGSYTYYAPQNVSEEQAKRTALERAKIQILADEFGTVVGSNTSTRITTEEGTSTVDMLSLSESEVRGQWIETLSEEYDVFYQGGLVVRVKLKGRIRELLRSEVAIDARLLRNGTDDRDEADAFRSGDDLYLAFRSPADGTLAAYLYDGDNTVYCLLPYRGQASGRTTVRANRRYVFFSRDERDFDTPLSLVEEYQLVTDRQQEHNRIYIVFSPNDFTKAIDGTNGRSELPRMLDFASFQQWLTKCRKQDVDMVVINKDIDITR
jgi:hypothetical protein